MKHSQDLLEKHKLDWGEHIRMVGINFASQKDLVLEHVNDKNLKSIDHFYIPWASHNAFDNYSQDTPYFVLIDGKGIVGYIGNAKNIDLEKTIDGFVTNEHKEMQDLSTYKALSKQLSKQVVELLKREEFREAKYKLSIQWKKETFFDAGKA